MKHVAVRCPSCGWASQRVAHDPRNPGVDVGGYGPCMKCGTRMLRTTVSADRRAQKARMEIEEQERKTS